MSVLINGMEMPDKCGHCRFASAFDCGVTGNFISTHSIRQPDCPLVPVPPHGRLIDADALAHDLDDDVENDQRALDEMDFVGKERERVQFDKDCKQNCMWYLSEAPTIIPADGKDTNVPTRKEGET